MLVLFGVLSTVCWLPNKVFMKDGALTALVKWHHDYYATKVERRWRAHIRRRRFLRFCLAARRFHPLYPTHRIHPS